MPIRDRIFALVFPDRRRGRRGEEESRPVPRARKRGAKHTDAEGFDPRYFVHHQR